MTIFKEERYCKLFQARLGKASTEDELFELLEEVNQITLASVSSSLAVKELESKVKSKLNSISIPNRGEEKEKNSLAFDVANEECAPPPLDVLQMQKLKLLQLENLLVDSSSTMQQHDKVVGANPEPSNLLLKKRILFNASLNGNESAGEDEDEHELILRKDRAEQEKLQDLLAEKANQLIENSQTFSQKISSDSSRLDTLESKLSDNVEKAVKERESMQKISSGTWKTTIMIWGSILIGILLFLWMFLYMRMIAPVKIRYKTETETVTATAISASSHSASSSSSHSSTTLDHDHHDHHHDWDEF